ncbi:AAA family ATPase [Eoetvoesiella caeni]|uniref:AAA domain-containing protein n=1 Tax=Eoetvoesiella caeni TaxID=645616 RepID=A0A366HFW6_9BURK|nr:AAA family ATPase [Eoetvoesiella caeni]MCI2808462.1 AAA family ATPase [Eoetvoesiella caeni]NYT55003.1 AAA family ATPase [Eoetvoesiella caeni]RBP41024.1 AAA domain-containing protein [Eoetvoesiella caeni]
MSFDQEKPESGRNPLRSKETSPLNEPVQSIGHLAPTGFDNLPAQHAAQCGPYQHGGNPVIAAPAAPQPDRWACIPQELRERSQWCVAGEDKAPRIATQGLPHARVNDSSTWRTFDEASAFAAHHGLHIGYMLHESDPFTCIDLDVKDDTTPEQLGRFQKIVDAADSYTEHSRSGRGLHVWVTGKVAKGMRRDGVEVYSHERFMICTGNPLHQKPIAPRPELLDMLAADMGRTETAQPLADGPEVEADEAILQRATSAANGAKFQALFSGDWQAIGHTDHSKADAQLVQMLAEYSANNEQVKRLFLQSVLGQRDKATKRKDYLDRTLAQARAHQANEPNAKHGELIALQLLAGELVKRMAPKRPTRVTPAGGLRLVAANEIASRPPMKWLVRGVLPEKGIGAIFGQPGSGKSFLVLDLLAAVAGGFHWFGIPTKAAPVVYITLEGQAGMPQRIHAYRTKKGTLDRIAFIEQPIDLREPDTLKELVSLILDAGLGGGVVCIDTLAASAPGMDENTSADMGQLIANLQDLQTELGGFVLVVHHSGKDETRGLRGWSGLNGALDCAIAVSRVSEDKQNTSRRWEVSKSKDGSDGMKNDFALEQVFLDYDEDGQPITSCVISHTMQEHVSASETDADDDEFIWQWVHQQVVAGKYPSKNSLKAQLSEMKPHRGITQQRVLASIERLMAASRLAKEKNSPSGNDWLRAMECAG